MERIVDGCVRACGPCVAHVRVRRCALTRNGFGKPQAQGMQGMQAMLAMQPVAVYLQCFERSPPPTRAPMAVWVVMMALDTQTMRGVGGGRD